MKKTFFSILTLAFFSASMTMAAEIRINAGGALIETYVKPTRAVYEKQSGNTIKFEERGFKNGMENLEKGYADILQSGFFSTEVAEKVKSERVNIKNFSAFKVTPVTEEDVLVAVNNMNPVTRLSKQQLKDIFTGKAKSWKDVGGEDMPIVVVWNRFLQGPNQAFNNQIMDGAKLLTEFHSAKGFGEAKTFVRGKPGAIMLYPTRIKDAALKYPEAPKAKRATIFITKGEPNPAVKSYMDFLVAEINKKK